VTFSIITPTFNSRDTLGLAMESVLSQEGVDLEYLIVDGGSTDGTVELIRDYAARDSRIRWMSEPDRGIADAFNKGIGMATGEWVGITNSDDRLAAGALAPVAEAARRNPAADVIHGDMLRFDEQGRPMFVLKPLDLERAIWRQMPLNHPATFVAREVYRRCGGFDATLHYSMDYDLVLRLYREGCCFVYLPVVLAEMAYGGASDERFWACAREASRVAIRHGSPPPAAYLHLLRNGVKGAVKQLLRRAGLASWLRCHPRFRGPGAS